MPVVPNYVPDTTDPLSTPVISWRLGFAGRMEKAAEADPRVRKLLSGENGLEPIDHAALAAHRTIIGQ